MEFKKYQHVERFGTTEVNGIENGMCYIFPKIDGTNGSLWYEKGEMKAGSRNRELTLDNDNQGFYNWAVTQMETIGQFLIANPKLRLYGEWLCLSGDTKIRLVSGGKRGHVMTLREMYNYSVTQVKEKNYYKTKKGNKICYVNRQPWWKRYGYPQCFSLFIDEDKIKPQRIKKIIKTGDKDVFEIKTRKGYLIKATKDHKFFTNNGWVSLFDLNIDDVVAVTELFNHTKKRRYGKGSLKITKMFKELRDNNDCAKCGSKTSLEVHHIDENWKNNDIKNLEVLCRECHKNSHNNITAINQSFDYEFDKIVSLKHIGVEDCYDISMGVGENSSSFIANGFVVHNCPHTLKTYQDNAWRKFYVFDVMDGERYLSYEEYRKLLDVYDIEYIPPICKVKNPTYERLVNQLEKNGYLIKDGEGSGEGIVVKNYAFVNKFGRTTWAKIVKNEFKSKHAKVDVTELNENKIIEEEIVNKYVTKALVDKEFSKIESSDGWSSKFISRLLNTVYYCLVKEESWNFVKEFKNPQIDFKRLHYFTINKVKELKQEIF